MDVSELDRSIERGIKAIAQRIWRRKLVFILTSGVVFAGVLAFVLTIQPIYEGSTLLVAGQESLDTAAQAAAGRPPAETSNALMRIAESEEVVSAAISKIGVDKLAPGLKPAATPLFARLRERFVPSAANDGPPVLSPLETLLPIMKAGLSVRSEPNSDVIQISFRHPDPVIATNFVNAVAQAFLDRQNSLLSRPGAADFFLRQRQHFDDELKTASTALQDFSARTGAYSIDDQRKLLLTRQSDLASALATTRGSIAQKSGQRQALGDELRRLAPVTRSAYVTGLVDNLSSTPGAPRVTDTRTVEDRSSDPPLLLIRVYQDNMVTLFQINSDLAGAQSLERDQLAELDHVKADLNVLAQNAQRFDELKRAVAQATLNSDTYASRMTEAQITEESRAAKFSTVKVLQKATVPTRPVFPNYPLFAFAGLILASAVGAGFASLRPVPTRSRRIDHGLAISAHGD